MSHPSPLVMLSALTHAFDDGAPVVRDVDLTIREGEAVALVGPSGCGKSTLLRLMAGLLRPTLGRLAVTGEPETAFVFQEPTLLPWLTAAENVATPLTLRGVPSDEREARARECLARVGLSDRSAFFPRQLSGGQKMRVSLARALAVRPQLMLLDEPFAALDELTRDRLNEDLLRLREQDRWTVVLVTHSVSEAVFGADRIVLLEPNPGRIHRIVDVDLPYPRIHDMRSGDNYHRLVDSVSSSLRALTPALA